MRSLVLLVLLSFPFTVLAEGGNGTESTEIYGTYIMERDQVTALTLNDDSTYVYEDPMERYSSSYSHKGDKVVLSFQGFNWYGGTSLDCTRGGTSLSCSDSETYVHESVLGEDRIFGKYRDPDNPDVSLALQKDMHYMYATPEGVCTYKYEIEGDRITVFLWDCESLGKGAMTCSRKEDTLKCSNGVSYKR